MSDYAPYVNPISLETMPLVATDVTGTNVTHGTDAPNTVPPVPSTMPLAGLAKFFDVIDTTIFGNIVPNIGRSGVTPEAQKQITAEQTKKVLWSVLLVVIGLMLLSRGFGLLGEEGENVIVNLSNPSKYPGIGHAIQGMKGKK